MDRLLYQKNSPKKVEYSILIADHMEIYSNISIKFNVTIKGDLPPHTIYWDFDGDGKKDTEVSDSLITDNPNEYLYYTNFRYNRTGTFSVMFYLEGLDLRMHHKQIIVNVTNPSLVFSIYPEQSHLISGENITLYAILENQGRLPINVTIPSIEGNSLDLYIITPGGYMVERYGPMISVYPGLTEIQPFSQNIKKGLDLCSNFLFFGNVTNGMVNYKFNETGSYLVKGQYHSSRGWVGILINETIFEVRSQ